MTESDGSNGSDLFDRWTAAHADQQAGDVAPPALPRRARAVPYDSPPVFERATFEPLAEVAPEPLVGTAAQPLVEAAAQALAAPAPTPVATPVATPAPAPTVIPAPAAAVPAAAAPSPATPQPSGPEPADEQVPHTLIFKPRRATRTALTSVLVVWVLASVAAVAAAWQSPSQPSIGIAAAIVILTALTWVVRGGTSVARLTVRGGTLEIRKAGLRTTFSLSDSYQLIDVVGKPGSMGWKVLFRRKDLEPFVVDASLVDPKEFMRVLTYYRPELAR